MYRRVYAVLALVGLVLVACAGGANVGRSSATPNADSFDESPTAISGNAALADKDGKVVGLATFRDTRLGVRVEIKVTGLPPGKHGTHIHEVGKCEGPDFASAGGHFNINAQQHGIPGAVSAHAGEIPNLEVGADGRGSVLFYSPHLSLNKAASNGLTFGNGTAVIVHANEDDYRSQPAGNSGARIACGVVKLPA
jgi:Cu-Zn family superoxide dismutase